MKKVLKWLALAVTTVLVVTIASLRVFGFEPQDQRPGLWLAGELVEDPVSDWSFTDVEEEIYVQTRTPYGIPHSVTTYCVVFDDEFYLFSAYYGGGTFPDDRSWNRNVIRDPRVRLKIGENLYDQRVIHVTEEPLRRDVHQAFIDKYPQWNSPGLENVHILRVE